MSFDIEEELKKLPAKPGVYIMHDSEDRIIYIGKAVILKNRVRQYFRSGNKSLKIQQMVPQIARFEYIVTDSELEALILECNLIKENRPKYNTMLKDDKSYPFLCVTVQEDYPRIMFVRRPGKNKEKYFGPYSSAYSVKETAELARRLFKIRHCSRKLPADIGKERPCLYHHIHQCDAPCQGYISKEEYRKNVDAALDFLNGNFKEVMAELKNKMDAAAEAMRFEEAAELRDLIASVNRIGEYQKATNAAGEDRDVIALAVSGTEAIALVFCVRDGKMIGREHYYLQTAPGEEHSEILESFIKQYYSSAPFIPKQLILSEPIKESKLLSEWLGVRRNGKVGIAVPVKGKKEKLVELAVRNAQILLEDDLGRLKREEERTTGALEQLGSLIGIEGLNRIEAFDISNTSGFQSVGSMVVFEGGKPKKSDYRKFRIRSVEGPDDYASLQEVLRRRFIRSKEDKGFEDLPELILMDGGKGQVNTALKLCGEMGIDVSICGMVKDDKHRTRGLYHNGKEVPLDKRSDVFHLITRIQDEAHRFAINYHKLLRGKNQVYSVLDDIKGIGPKRRRTLMKHYEGLGDIRSASLEELSALPSMDARSARAVYEFFHRENSDIQQAELSAVQGGK